MFIDLSPASAQRAEGENRNRNRKQRRARFSKGIVNQEGKVKDFCFVFLSEFLVCFFPISNELSVSLFPSHYFELASYPALVGGGTTHW